MKSYKRFIAVILIISAAVMQAWCLPEYKTSYLKENVKAASITNNKILGSVKQFFPYIGYICSTENSVIFFTEDSQTGDYYSEAEKRLYQWDGTYLRYLGDLKKEFQSGKEFFINLNAELYTSSVTFTREENGVKYYSGSVSGNLVGGWNVEMGFDGEGKLVSVKESSDYFTFKPKQYWSFFNEMPDFLLFELTSREVYQVAVDDLNAEEDTVSKDFFDRLTQNNWKTLTYRSETASYLEEFSW